MKIKFDGDPLVVEQDNYATKILSIYIVCELNTWSKNPPGNFALKIAYFVQLT